MSTDLKDLCIDEARFRESFEALAAIGATPEGGVHRPAYSQAHLEARRWFLAAAQREELNAVQGAQLEAAVDGAGNHSARLRCGPPGAPTLLLGSHLDSVPYGGRFDGALGVMAALEVLRTVKDRGLRLKAHLEAVDFTDEEGRYANFVGSLGLTGRLERKDIQRPRGGREAFRAALARAGLNEDALFTAGRDPATLAGYLELHVEQGGRLAERGMAIGIVTAIVGIRSFKLHFLGRADHAGTTPMGQRRDAVQGAAAFSLAVRETAMAEFPACVATVGNMEFEPGAYNVVARCATVFLEFRAAEEATLDGMEASFRERAVAAARRFGLGLEVENPDRAAPAHMDGRVQAAFAGACEGLGLRHTCLASGAGHDAQCLAAVCPAGMIFVPSVGGRSHSALEFTEWEDCVNGANVLLRAAVALAGG